jgi:hypothetical protein
MSSSQDSIDQIPEAPQVPANNVVPLTTKKMVTEEVTNQLEEVTRALEDLKKEFASRKENAGGSMSDAPSKDYIDRKTSEIESKNEIDRIKIDAKFEKLVSDSDIKFERLMGEMNAKFAQTEVNIAKTEASHTKWMIGLTIATIAAITGILGRFLPSYKDIAQINERFAVVDKQLDSINSRVNTVNVNLTELKSDVAQINMIVKEQEKQKPKK